MTLDDVLDLHDYWKEHPPVQWMVQAYLGIQPEKPRTGPPMVERMAGVSVGKAVKSFY